MPLDTHEAFIAPVASQWNTGFSQALLFKEMFSIGVKVATGHSVICPDGTHSIPDLCVQLCTLIGTNDLELTTFQDLVVVESAYSQSETSVLKKFTCYIQCNPTPLALLMIKIKTNFSKPSNSPDLPTVRHCMNEEVLSELDFKWRAERCSYQVVHEGISWINIMQIEVHLWLHLGDKPIDLKVKNPNHPETVYAFSVHFISTKHCNFLLIHSTLKTLYPTLSTDAIDGLLGRTMDLFKNLI